MANPIIYGPAFSTFVRSVLLALEEKGAGYDLVEVNILEDAHKTPEHLARHPFGKVPAFEHDGFALYETAAILRYVDETFDGPSLQPSDAKGRARMMQAIGIVNAYGYPAIVGQIVIQRLVVPLLGGEPDETAIESALPQARTSIEALEATLDGNAFLAGDALSLADLHLVPVYEYLSQTPEGEKILARMPNLTRWWSGIGQRPSVVKTRPSLG